MTYLKELVDRVDSCSLFFSFFYQYFSNDHEELHLHVHSHVHSCACTHAFMHDIKMWEHWLSLLSLTIFFLQPPGNLESLADSYAEVRNAVMNCAKEVQNENPHENAPPSAIEARTSLASEGMKCLVLLERLLCEFY